MTAAAFLLECLVGEPVLERGIPLCMGSDSNVRIDPLEEQRRRRASCRAIVRQLIEDKAFMIDSWSGV